MPSKQLDMDESREFRRDNPSQFKFLDGIRGVLALTVICHHYYFAGRLQIWAIFVPFGSTIGVPGFFILSSFLITYRGLFEVMHINFCSPKNSWRQFISWLVCYWIRRMARIYPLYLFVILIARYGPAFTRVYRRLPGLWDQILLIDSGTDIFWTIRVEVVSYSILPFIILAAKIAGKKGAIPLLIVLGIITFLSDHLITSQRVSGKICSYCSNFPSWLSLFIWGSMLAIIYFWYEQFSKNWNINRVLSIMVKSLLNILCVFMVGFFIITTGARWNYKYSIGQGNNPGYYHGITLLFALLSREGLFTDLFTGTFLRFLGKISYSLYLIHRIFWVLIETWLPPKYEMGFEGFLLTVASSIVGPTITYHLVEEPGINMGLWFVRWTEYLLLDKERKPVAWFKWATNLRQRLFRYEQQQYISINVTQ